MGFSSKKHWMVSTDFDGLVAEKDYLLAKNMVSLLHFSSVVTFCLFSNAASQVEFPMGVICTYGNSTCLCSGRSSWGRALCDLYNLDALFVFLHGPENAESGLFESLRDECRPQDREEEVGLVGPTKSRMGSNLAVLGLMLGRTGASLGPTLAPTSAQLEPTGARHVATWASLDATWA